MQYWKNVESNSALKNTFGWTNIFFAKCNRPTINFVKMITNHFTKSLIFFRVAFPNGMTHYGSILKGACFGFNRFNRERYKILYIPENFNMSISHQLFDYTITFVNCYLLTQEHKFKSWVCTKKTVLNVHFRDFLYTKINLTQIWYDELRNKPWIQK